LGAGNNEQEHEMALRIRRDDMVEVISGKDAGKRGKVLRVDPGKSRLYVEGLNVVKRHQRPRSLKDTQRGGRVGGVIEKEGPIHVSNVMLVDPKEDKPTRLGIERAPDGKRVRVAKRSGTRLE
jgi:large subunit ribosomal protein L24